MCLSYKDNKMYKHLADERKDGPCREEMVQDARSVHEGEGENKRR